MINILPVTSRTPVAKRTHAVLWSIAVFIWFSATSAFANHAQVHFGTFDLPPYGFQDGIHTKRGLIRDIHKAIADQAGLSFVDFVMPLKRINKELQKGIVNCSTFIPLKNSLENLTQVAEIYANLNSVVIPKHGLKITRLEDLYGQTIAIPRGAYSGSPISSDPNIKRLATNDYNQSAAVLKAGRVDAIVGSEIAIYFSLHKPGISKSNIGDPFIFLQSPLWLQCRQDMPVSYVNKLRVAAKFLRANGVFARLRATYSNEMNFE